MIVIDNEKNITLNRGDRATIKLTSSGSNFKSGDKLRLSIVDRRNYDNVVFQKEYPISEDADTAYITLTKEDTAIGPIISRPKEYWYEIEYDGDMTIVGYDSNGAKKFTLLPEAPERSDS